MRRLWQCLGLELSLGLLAACSRAPTSTKICEQAPSLRHRIKNRITTPQLHAIPSLFR